MIKECISANAGLIFDDRYLKVLGLRPDGTSFETERAPNIQTDVAPQPSEHIPRGIISRLAAHPPSAAGLSGSTHEVAQALALIMHARDRQDTIAKIYDQLKTAIHWWVLEFIPMGSTFQKLDGSWMRERR